MASNWNKWNRTAYHPNFKKRALLRKQRVNYICEKCSVAQGEMRTNKKGHPYRVVVAAAHVDHDPMNPRAKLIILCQRCHIWHDRYDHADKMRRTKYRKQREALIEAGQLELFDE